MKRFLVIPFLLVLVISSGCNQSYTQVPTETSTLAPIPTETPIPPTSTPEPTSTPITSVTFQRGINMGDMLEAPNKGEWGLFVKEEYFDIIKEAGFDFVRLPVNWKAHATYHGNDDGDVGYDIDPAFFARVDEVVGWALKRNLSIIIDFHNYEELMTEPNGEQFWYLWRQIAEHYKDYPPQVLF